MARTPQFTRAEAESLIGPRGNLKVTVANRRDVRKWLVACGISSSVVGALPLATLQAAYNDVSGAVLVDLKRNGAPREKTEAEKLEEWTQFGEQARNAGRSRDSCPAIFAQYRAAWLDGYDRAASETPKQEETPKMDTPAPTPAPVPNGHDLTIGEQGKLALLQKLLTPDLDQDAIRAIARDEAHKASMTPDAVRDYIAKTLPDLIPVMRLEIKTPHAIKDLGEKARHKQFRELFLLVSARLSVMMVGPAGSGKTTACEQVAEALGLSFFVQGATTGTHELLGYKDAHGTYHTTAFRHAFEHGGFICMDEIDAGDAGAILVLNAALANGYMTFPDSPHPVKRHADFYVVACANTFGHGADRQYVGRNQLDAATLDRFARLAWQYDERLERAIAGNDRWTDRVQKLRAAAAAEKVRIVISPRASIYGARAQANGATQAECEDWFVFSGTDADSRSRIERKAKEI
jgi:ribosome modulation factor